MINKLHASVVATGLLLGGCLGGGGGGGGGDGASVASSTAGAGSTASSPSPSPSPGPSPSPSPSPAPSPSPGGLYDRDPIPTSCDVGQLKLAEKQGALATLNQMRAAHGLGTVTYDNTFDISTAQSALLGVANRSLSHTPPTSWLCFTTDGYNGSSTSNLYLRWSSVPSQPTTASGLEALLVDDNVPSLGHRRWMLHPFLGTTSFGRVDGVPSGTTNYYTAMSLKVIGGTDANPAGTDAATRGYVAYPYGDYPARWFKHGWYMSFSVLANTASTWNNGSGQVNYGSTTVTVTGPSGALAVSNQSADYSGYGLPNSLQWQVAGTVSNVSYTVNVSNVVVNGTPRNYSYTFRVVP